MLIWYEKYSRQCKMMPSGPPEFIPKTKPAHPLIWTHWKFYKGFSDKERFPKLGQPSQPGWWRGPIKYLPTLTPYGVILTPAGWKLWSHACGPVSHAWLKNVSCCCLSWHNFQKYVNSDPCKERKPCVKWINQGSDSLEKSLNFRGSPWKVLKFHLSLKSP